MSTRKIGAAVIDGVRGFKHERDTAPGVGLRPGANGLGGEKVQPLADPADDAAWDVVNSEVDETKRLGAPKRSCEMTADIAPLLLTARGLLLIVYQLARLAGVPNDGGPNAPFFGTLLVHRAGHR